jgi:MFS family permease
VKSIDTQIIKFSAYGFLKNLRFFDPFILLFFREVGLSFTEIGLLFSIRAISIVILEIPTGILADSIGRKTSMILSFISYILSFLLFYFFDVFSIFTLSMVFFALGEALRSGTHKAMILDYLKINNRENEKIETYGYTRSWSQKGSAISALLAGTMVFYTGEYRIIFLASTIPYILELFLISSYPNKLNGETHRHNFIKDIRGQMLENTRSLLSVIKQPSVLRGLGNSAIFDGLFKTVKDYIQPLLVSVFITLPLAFSNEHNSAILIAIIYFIIFILSAYSSKHAAKIMTYFSSLITAINSTFLLGVGVIFSVGLFYTFNLLWASLFFFALLFVIQNIRRPLNISYLSRVIPSNIMASGLSVESQIKTLIVVVFAPIMGLLADTFNIGIALIILASAVLIVFQMVKIENN